MASLLFSCFERMLSKCEIMGTSSNLTQKSSRQVIGCEKFQTKKGQQISNFSKFQVFCPIFQKRNFCSNLFGGASYGLVYISH